MATGSFVQGMNLGSRIYQDSVANELAREQAARQREAHDAEMAQRRILLGREKEEDAYRAAIRAVPTERPTNEVGPVNESTMRALRLNDAAGQQVLAQNAEFGPEGTAAALNAAQYAMPRGAVNFAATDAGVVGPGFAERTSYDVTKDQGAVARKFGRIADQAAYENLLAAERKKYTDRFNKTFGDIRAKAAMMEWNGANASNVFKEVSKMYDMLPDDMRAAFVNVGGSYVPVQVDESGVANPIIGPNGRPVTISSKDDMLRALDMFHAAANGPDAIRVVEDSYLRRAKEKAEADRAAAAESRAVEIHGENLSTARRQNRIAEATERDTITHSALQNDLLRADIERAKAAAASSYASAAQARKAAESNNYFPATPMIGPDGTMALVQVSKTGKEPAIISQMPAGYKAPKDVVTDSHILTVASRIAAETNQPVGPIVNQIRAAIGGVDVDSKIIDSLKALQQGKAAPNKPYDPQAGLRGVMAQQPGPPVVDMNRAREIAARNRPAPFPEQQGRGLGNALNYLPR